MPIGLEHSTADLHLLRPLIVPAAYFASGAFPAPHRAMARSDLALTWVVLNAPGAMVYLTPRVATEWEGQRIDWRARALENLRAEDRGRVWTHEKADASGRRRWVAMMHLDGLGSSRLLCTSELRAAFPEGYQVGLPDRSCALAISTALSSAELAEVTALVEKSYSGATTPMHSGLFDPSGLVESAA